MSITKPRIGITLGDCAGIGPEIVETALKSGRVPKSADYKTIGKYPDCTPGHPTAETARAAGAALEEAVILGRRGELDAIVTGPIHKARMYEVGFKFPGQTEFFAARCGVKNWSQRTFHWAKFRARLSNQRLSASVCCLRISCHAVGRRVDRRWIDRVLRREDGVSPLPD
jgi:4-hydroxy-L-threonine phosphate dehydrogenase PdxA